MGALRSRTRALENEPKRARICFVSGTGTGVGKSLLTGLFVSHLRRAGVRVRAIKPISTGDRGDARWLRAAQGGELSLDEINPYHYAKPLAPLLAARAERRRLSLRRVCGVILRAAERCDWLLVEGAGGWLSPLGEGFSLAEVHASVGGSIIIVGRNELGVIHGVRSTLLALGEAAGSVAAIVLSGGGRGMVARSNASLMREFSNRKEVLELENMGKTGLKTALLVEGEKKSKNLLRELWSLINSPPLSGTAESRKKPEKPVDSAKRSG